MKKRRSSSKTIANRITIDPCDPDPETIRLAVDHLRHAGTLIYPTSGLYGLGADAWSEQAVRRVYAIKSRPLHKPLLVLLSDVDDLERLVQSVPDYAEALMALWPGGITLIFHAKGNVPAALTGGTGKIAARLPAHPVAKGLTRRFGGPITGTSANRSGVPAVHRADRLDPEIYRQVDLVLDAGTLAGGPGSTIVDVTCWPIKVIREGAIGQAAIQAALNQSS